MSIGIVVGEPGSVLVGFASTPKMFDEFRMLIDVAIDQTMRNTRAIPLFQSGV